MRSAALLAAVLAASTAAALVSAAEEATSEAGGEAPSSQQSVPLPPQPPPHGPLPHVFPQPPPFGPPLPQPPPPPPPRPLPQPPICQLPTLPWLFPEWRRPESILWSQFNCDDEVGDGDADVARVVDFACCHDDHCDKIEKRHQCRADITCQWKRGRCTINRDKESNVCCRGQVHEYCVDLVAGRCPLDFQVLFLVSILNNVSISSLFYWCFKNIFCTAVGKFPSVFPRFFQPRSPLAAVTSPR